MFFIRVLKGGDSGQANADVGRRMREGVEKFKALLRLSRTGSGSGSLRAGSGPGRLWLRQPWTPKLGRWRVRVVEDKFLSFFRRK